MQPTLPQTAADARADDDDRFWRGALTGLTPLLALVVVALAAAGAALARALAAPLGFLAWQWIVAGAWGGGLVIAAIVYIVGARGALRQARVWRDAGLTRLASGATWALGVSALLILAPFILALALPQHPAP